MIEAGWQTEPPNKGPQRTYPATPPGVTIDIPLSGPVR